MSSLYIQFLSDILLDHLLDPSLHFFRDLRGMHIFIFLIIHRRKDMHLHCDPLCRTGIKSLKRIDQCNRNDRAFRLGGSLKTAALE